MRPPTSAMTRASVAAKMATLRRPWSAISSVTATMIGTGLTAISSAGTSRLAKVPLSSRRSLVGVEGRHSLQCAGGSGQRRCAAAGHEAADGETQRRWVTPGLLYANGRHR